MGDLVAAVRAQDMDAVLGLLPKRDINETAKDGKTALHVAALMGNLEILERLTSEASINPNIQDTNGNLPLHYAAERGDAMACYTLIAVGSKKNVKNKTGQKPIDLTQNPKVRELLSSSTSINASTINSKSTKPEWRSLIPTDPEVLRLLCIELIEAQEAFQERCQETILQLIEEKHVALCKNRLMEQAAGITDKDTSMRFIDQLQYWQDENERQSATIAYLKIRLNMVEVTAAQHEEYYRKNLADLTKQHTEQLQAIFRRNEETERAFLAYQKAHSEEFAELSRLRAELAGMKKTTGGTGGNPEMQALYTQLQQVKKELAEVQADKKSLEERLNLSENLKKMTERENAEIRADINKLRRTLQEEMINQLQGARREQDEKDETMGTIIFVKGEGGSKRIKGATPEKLVERLVDPTTFDNQFLQVFMLTFKVFMTSRQLMDIIVRLFKDSSKTETVAGEIGLQPPVLLKIVNTLKFWLENYWCDFQEDPTLLKDLTNFIDTLQDEKLIGILQTVVTRKLTNQASPIPDKNLPVAPKPVLPKSLVKRMSTEQMGLKPGAAGWPFGKKGNGTPQGYSQAYEEEYKFKLMDLEPVEIARQLTLIESELFLNIQVREFLDLAWMKEDKEIRAPNVTRMIQWSNHAIHWVVSEIVSVKDSIRARAQVFEKFVLVAQHLEKLNNFNGIKEVLAALQSSSVVPNKVLRIFEDLLKLISSELNYKALRAKVHASELPLIPFPGVYQGDLVVLRHEQIFTRPSKDILDNGLINFHKFQKVASYILEIQGRYSLEPVIEIQEYIRNYPILNDDQAYTQSLACEARGA
ncbi:hypothetical protein HDU96_004486 [Phlyctochytrium bullatum]|nr:hypothetical protein HDU96_004486 [Phlyctochytrium bullatum]